MKKQFFLLAVLIFTGICFSFLKDNSLKACGTNTSATGCPATNKNCRYKMPVEYVEDVDASFNIFMNPFN